MKGKGGGGSRVQIHAHCGERVRGMQYSRRSYMRNFADLAPDLCRAPFPAHHWGAPLLGGDGGVHVPACGSCSKSRWGRIQGFCGQGTKIGGPGGGIVTLALYL